MNAVAERALAARSESVNESVTSAERRRVVRISAALFVVTFLAYWLLGPFTTAYDFQLSQANNLIHGHLDMTAEYTRNLNVLERVLFDGEGFCIPAEDPRGPGPTSEIENPRITADCRTYMQHSLGPALLLVPLVALLGLSVSQVVVSALVGAATAVVVYAIARHFTSNTRAQLALTALAIFGTQFFYSAPDGSVWHFAHTTAVFFLFGAIYATVVMRSPLLAGALVGAAFMCRPTTILAGLFTIVAFSDTWLVHRPGQSLLQRLRLRPLFELALGVAPFLVLTLTLNALRFGNPFESGYAFSEQVHQVGLRHVYEHGIFDIGYISRHIPVFWEQMPIFSSEAPFIRPSWAGLAVWATSPALLIGLFVHLRHSASVARLIALALVLGGGLMLVIAAARGWGLASWTISDVPMGIHLWPFLLAIGLAVGMAIVLRDRLVVACWATIIPIIVVNWTFAATGWAQFGYRYSLDFMPFLVLLVMIAMPRVRTWHLALIVGSVLVNLWGVLWIFKFAPAELFGWTWVSY